MTDGININSFFSGKAKEIATNIDNKYVKDGNLSGAELSVFLAECQKSDIAVEKEPWYEKYSAALSKYMDDIKEHLKNFTPNTEEVAKRDATYVAPTPEVALMKQKEAANKKDSNVTSLQKPLKLGSTSNIRTNYDWSEEEFANVLNQMLNAPRYKGKFKNSVLQGKAKAFIESGKKFNIDPRILVAIAMCESQRGISKKALQLNNIGGLKINGKYHHFETIEASIDSIAKTMESRYEEGFTTPSKIAYSGKYCAKSAAKTWLSNIRSYLGFFDRYYKD